MGNISKKAKTTYNWFNKSFKNCTFHSILQAGDNCALCLVYFPSFSAGLSVYIYSLL